MTATTAQSFQSDLDLLGGYYPQQVAELKRKWGTALQQAQEATANVVGNIPNINFNRIRRDALEKGDEEKKKEIQYDRSQATTNAGKALKIILFWGVAAAVVCAGAPLALAAFKATLFGGGILTSMATAAAGTSVGSIKLAALGGVLYGIAKSSDKSKNQDYIQMAWDGLTNSWSHNKTKNSVINREIAATLQQEQNKMAVELQGASQQAKVTQQQRELLAANSGFSAPAQATAASPSYEELLTSLFNSTNLNDPALLDKIPDNAFNNTTTGFAPLQRTTHVLTQYAENEIRDKIDELSQNLDPDVFYPLLIELEKKAKSVNSNSQLGQILKVCTDHGKKLREGAMVEAVEMINQCANSTLAKPDDVSDCLQALRYLGVFKYTGRNTKIDDEVLEPGSPLRKKLMGIIMNTNTGPDFTALDTLIKYNNPNITSQEFRDLKQLQEIAQRTAYIAEGKQAAHLLNDLQAKIDTWAAAGSAAGSNGTVPPTQPIIDALDALETAGYLAFNTTSSVWDIPQHKLAGNNGDNVMLRALEQQYIAATGGHYPPLMNHGLVDPNTLPGPTGPSTPFSLTTQLQGSNPDHLAKLQVLQQHIATQSTLFSQWMSGQNLPTP